MARIFHAKRCANCISVQIDPVGTVCSISYFRAELVYTIYTENVFALAQKPILYSVNGALFSIVILNIFLLGLCCRSGYRSLWFGLKKHSLRQKQSSKNIWFWSITLGKLRHENDENGACSMVFNWGYWRTPLYNGQWCVWAFYLILCANNKQSNKISPSSKILSFLRWGFGVVLWEIYTLGEYSDSR